MEAKLKELMPFIQAFNKLAQSGQLTNRYILAFCEIVDEIFSE